MGSFDSQKEAVPGISAYTVWFLAFWKKKKNSCWVADDRLFTIHELDSTLTVQSPYNDTVIASVPIFPSNQEGANYAAAEILIRTSPQIPEPYIYVSNRNKGLPTTEGDSIGIFKLVNQGQEGEGLVLIKQVFTGLSQIRSMEIGNPANGGDQFLIAGAASGDGGVAVFRRTEGGGDLELVARNREVPNRTAFVFVWYSHWKFHEPLVKSGRWDDISWDKASYNLTECLTLSTSWNWLATWLIK